MKSLFCAALIALAMPAAIAFSMSLDPPDRLGIAPGIESITGPQLADSFGPTLERQRFVLGLISFLSEDGAGLLPPFPGLDESPGAAAAASLAPNSDLSPTLGWDGRPGHPGTRSL